MVLDSVFVMRIVLFLVPILLFLLFNKKSIDIFEDNV